MYNIYFNIHKVVSFFIQARNGINKKELLFMPVLISFHIWKGERVKGKEVEGQ